jgi:hypothetical protein
MVPEYCSDIIRSGQAKSANRKFLGSFRYCKSANYFLRYSSPQIANPQIFMINPQIVNSQVSTNYCTTLSLNSPFRHDFFGSYNEPANRKSAKQPICGRSANLTNYSKPHFCGFAKLTCELPTLGYYIGPRGCSICRAIDVRFLLHTKIIIRN